MEYVDDNIELRSMLAMKIFPDFGGIIKGKKVCMNYLHIVFVRMPWLKLDNTEMNEDEHSVLIRCKNNDQAVDFYIQYYVNDDLKIYLLKSDTTEAYN